MKTEILYFDKLLARLRGIARDLAVTEQFWVGLAGAPGSGKSTLAEKLQSILGDLLVVIPMDGYHYYREELDAMDNPEEAHRRRGAPFTFNAERFVRDLQSARQERKGCFPVFEHIAGDPVEDGIQLKTTDRIVLVEGLYLLLDTEPWCRLRQWVFDETWFLNVPLQECNRRVVQRHMATGLSASEARRRVAINDTINGELVLKASLANADRVIPPF